MIYEYIVVIIYVSKVYQLAIYRSEQITEDKYLEMCNLIYQSLVYKKKYLVIHFNKLLYLKCGLAIHHKCIASYSKSTRLHVHSTCNALPIEFASILSNFNITNTYSYRGGEWELMEAMQWQLQLIMDAAFFKAMWWPQLRFHWTQNVTIKI